jgi:diaminopimelate decarboxylase
MPTSRRPDPARPSVDVLELGGVRLAEIVADPRVGTPSYVYDLDGMVADAKALHASFEGAPHLVSYAMKANSAGPVVRALAEAGCGADVVSGAELVLAMRCGIAPDAIVYSGVAKTDEELDLAIAGGPEGILAIQAESVEEIARVDARARTLGRTARISLRLNPALDADSLDTHRHINTGHDDAKFGIPLASVPTAFAAASASRNLTLVGLTAHVGSQVTATDGYLASARVVFRVAREARGRFPLRFVDTGGGFGIDYGAGCPVTPADFIRATRALQKEHGLDDLVLGCEPGRSLVGAHGVLLAKVIQRKVGDADRRWLMIDAGMNDLMRPALYQARHRVVPLEAAAGESLMWKVVGPVCESSDDFGPHELPAAAFGHVAILDAGAYGYSMASRYNGRALPAEVFLRGGQIVAVKERRPITDWVEDQLSAR